MSFRNVSIPLPLVLVGLLMLLPVTFLLGAISVPEGDPFPSEGSVSHGTSEARVIELKIARGSCNVELPIVVREIRVSIPDSTLTQTFPGCSGEMTSVQWDKVSDGTLVFFFFDGQKVELLVPPKGEIRILEDGGFELKLKELR